MKIGLVRDENKDVRELMDSKKVVELGVGKLV